MCVAFWVYEYDDLDLKSLASILKQYCELIVLVEIYAQGDLNFVGYCMLEP